MRFSRDASAGLSGAQMCSNHKKTGGRKSRDTLPLTNDGAWMECDTKGTKILLKSKSETFCAFCAFLRI